MSVIVLVGAYGVGKSEIATQLALLHRPCTLADLDVLNPFFRPREIQAHLKNLGIEVISSQLNRGHNQDTPSMSFGFMKSLKDQQDLIIDCAGSEHGLKPLASIKEVLSEAEIYFVVNLNRPESQLEHLQAMIHLFENTLQLKVSGLIHNTHLLDETTASQVIEAQRQLEGFAIKFGYPIRYTVVTAALWEAIHPYIHNPILKLTQLMLREEWMKGNTK